MKRKKDLLFLNKSDAVRHHFVLLLISIVLIVIATPVLVFTCRLENPLLQGSLTLGFQLVLGAFLSRTLYSFGISAKESVGLLDPSSLGKDWQVHRENVSIGDIRNIFENLALVAENSSGSTEEDVTDIACFAVAVWSLGSTLLLLILEITLVCSFGAFVLFVIASAAYYTGYTSAEIAVSPDEIHQIGYLIIIHLEFLSAKIPDSTKYSIQWKEKRKKKVLRNFIAETQLNSETIVFLKLSIQYPLGEAIVIKTPHKFDVVMSKTEDLVRKAKDWKLVSVREDGEIILRRDIEEFKMAVPVSHLFTDIDSSPTKVMLNGVLLEISTA